MFVVMLLLYALVVIALLIQYKIYGHFPRMVSSAGTSLTEEEECCTALQALCAAEIMQE